MVAGLDQLGMLAVRNGVLPGLGRRERGSDDARHEDGADEQSDEARARHPRGVTPDAAQRERAAERDGDQSATAAATANTLTRVGSSAMRPAAVRMPAREPAMLSRGTTMRPRASVAAPQPIATAPITTRRIPATRMAGLLPPP